MRLPPGAVEIRRVYTAETFRGRRLFTFALSEILEDLKRERIRTAYAHVLPANRSSSRAFLAVGFLPIGTVTVRKTVGRVSTTYADGAPPTDHRASVISDTINR
jgi:RimJ/RimL family protein N-acetyltransferase